MSLSTIGNLCSIASLIISLFITTKVLSISKSIKQQNKGDGNIASGRDTRIS